MLSRSPPKAVGMGRTTSAGGEPIVADLFILPTRVPSMGAPTTGTTALIPPPRPSFAFPSANPSTTSVAAAQPIPASGLPVHRLRRESLNSSSSSSISTRDRDNPNAYPYPANPSNPNLFSTGAGGTTTAAAGASVGGTSSLSSSPIPGALPIRRPHLNPVHPFKSNTISSGSGSSPSLSIRQGVSGHAQGHAPFVAGGGSPSSGVGGILPHNLHSRQASASSARVPPSPVHVASFTPSSLGDRDRRPGTSGSGSRASLDKDRERERRGSSSGVGVVVGERETESERTTHEGMSVPMAMPPRKRYSSSFGHRYVSSVGSATGGGVVGAGSGAGSASASGSGMSAGSGGKVVGEGGSPGSGNGSGVGVGPGREGGGARKEVCIFEFVVGVFPVFVCVIHFRVCIRFWTNPFTSFYISINPLSDVVSLFCAQGITSLLGVTTDDDDISIFVQHIDERKPLSSHDKERERDRDVLAMRAAAASGQGHDREVTDNTTTTSKGKQRATAAGQDGEDHEHEHEDEEDNGRLRFGLGLGHARYTTLSPPPISALVPGGNVTSTSTSNEVDDENAAAAALLSTSPTRGPMLTSRDEVDERLKRMNENFLKSLEGIGGSRSRGRGREMRKGSVATTTTTTRGGKEKEKERADDSSHSNSKEPSESAASSASAASNNNNKDNNNNSNNPPTSRFSQRTLDVGFPSTSSSSSSRGGAGGAADVYPSYPYNSNNNTPSLGLGLGRGRHTPLSSSAMLGNSDGISMASQGSEEVIGRMELYEERRRSGYHGG
jgi:autophagy-related protein 13